MTAEEARTRVDALLEANPWLDKKSNALYAWWDRFVRDWAVGVQITEAEYEQMWKITLTTFLRSARAKLGTSGGSTGGGTMSTGLGIQSRDR